jgi:hypothetical protein
MLLGIFKNNKCPENVQNMFIHSAEETNCTFLVVHVCEYSKGATLYASSSVFSVQAKVLLAYSETTSQK